MNHPSGWSRRWRALAALVAGSTLNCPFVGQAFAEAPRTPIEVHICLPESLPALFESFEVDAVVSSRLDAPGTQVQFHSSDGVRLTSGRTFTVDLVAGERRTFTAMAVVEALGDHTVGVRARRVADRATAVWGDLDSAYLHTTIDGSLTGFGPIRNGGVTCVVEPEGDPVLTSIGPEQGLAVPKGLERPVAPRLPTDGDPVFPRGGNAGLGGTISIGIDLTGRDPDNFLIPVGPFLGQVVNARNNEHIAWFWTDESGYGEAEFPDPGGFGFYVRWWAYMDWSSPGDDNLMVVRPNATSDWTAAHKYWTPAFTGLSGGPWYLGAFVLNSDDTRRGAFSILNDVNDAFLWAYYAGGLTRSPEGVQIEWQADSTIGTFYVIGGAIHLLGDDWGTRVDLRRPDAALHEYGHAVMYHVFGDYFPPHDCPSPHFIEQASGVHCGWTEGWANFFAMAAHGDSNFDWPGGFYMDLEPPTWGSPGWGNGALVEGRVAGALWDIFDSTNEGLDTVTSSFQNIWTAFTLRQETTFGDFYTAWRGLGFDDCYVVSAIYQNTIDFNGAPQISGLFDLYVHENSSFTHVVDLWAFTSDPECLDDQLTFEILIDTEPRAGVTLEANRWIDITPEPGFVGVTSITVRVSDDTGKAWTDTFLVTVENVNDPPETPRLTSGPVFGLTTVSVRFTASCTDPDGDDVRYRMNFGDGVVTAFSAPMPSGSTIAWDHTFESQGVFTVRAQALDAAGVVSRWSDPKTIDISDVSIRYGNVNVDRGAGRAEVLFVNGSIGDLTTRVLEVDKDSSLSVRLDAAPAGPANPKFGVWGWMGFPTSATDRVTTSGPFCLNPLLPSCGSRCPVFAASTVGVCAQLLCSTPEATGTGAGTVVLAFPPGRFPAKTFLTFQGLVKDRSDTSTALQYSVTNAVVVRIVD